MNYQLQDSVKYSGICIIEFHIVYGIPIKIMEFSKQYSWNINQISREFMENFEIFFQNF